MYIMYVKQVCPPILMDILKFLGLLELSPPLLTLPIELPPCSESELTNCSLQVLKPQGSSGRTLLAWLADRSCSLDFLLHCLRRMDHQEAVQYLSTTSNVETIMLKIKGSEFLGLFSTRV